ncbi:tetratricopeptide repeat protein [Streptomyces noursei]|uniref:tetratricopeptide repeat protein n=1 Tax=Streptomyces noursei TaxID=1971 RepID=UPI00167741CF|nr:tetratricopeptide repeat protein [Streptomyces noursei]MCZ1021339.1 tetratricopeptide repeat protein [Streptomyces noursei]GGX51795.1 hypothetical protein GCM10010341_86560 [Streptomyces noursei]
MSGPSAQAACQRAHGRADGHGHPGAIATTVNEIGGTAQLTGVVVQAGQIYGGIHHHATQELPPPRQLPRVSPHFTDRRDAALALDAARRDGASLAVISGLAGVGKTALATRWLANTAPEDEAQLHADLGGPPGRVAPEVVLPQWLRSLGIDRTPPGLRELAGLWRSVTARRAVTVLLDNAADPDQVRPLLPAGAKSMTVVTSRRLLWELAIDGAALLPLGPLTPSAAIALLTRFTGEGRIAAEPAAAARLARGCAFLPLPLVLAGARLKARPTRTLAAAADALVHPHHEDPARIAIATALTESYTGLETKAQYVYRSLGLMPVDAVDSHMVAAVCQLERAEAERLLEALAEEQVLEPCDSAPGRTVRYRAGAAVREHARTLAAEHDDPVAREGTARRLCLWLLANATQAQQRLTPAQATLRRTLPALVDAPVDFDDDLGAMAWLEAHENDLLGVLEAAVAAGSDEIAWQLVDAFWPLFLRRHPYVLWIKAHEIGLDAARRVGNSAAVRQMLLSGAIGLNAAGRLPEAIDWYTQARDAAQADGDVRDEGQALLGLGACHHQSGRPEGAKRDLTKAVTLWTSCGYRRGTALAAVLLGEIALTAGEPRRALDQLADAHAVLLDVDDPYDAARALALHGQARALLGDLTEGIAELESALQVFAAAGSTRWRARTLEMLGSAHRRGGDETTAQDCYRHAADLVSVILPAEAERLRQLE